MGEEVRVAVVGATGLVGQKLLQLLEERAFPVAGDPVAIASPRSVGRELSWKGRKIAVEALTPEVFEDVGMALFSAGVERSRAFAPVAAAAGAVVVDNSSAWRMDADVPLVVREVNPHAIMRRPKGIIANPNCTTMVLMVAAKPLHDAFRLVDLVVMTYQSVGGEGQAAITELAEQSRELLDVVGALRDRGADVGAALTPTCFPRPVAFNVVPHCGAFEDDRYTVEEHKLINESRKILDLPELRVSPTNVRVPVVIGHSLAARMSFSRPVSREQALAVLERAPGLKVLDGTGHDGEALAYPTALDCAGRDEVLVGRVREDPHDPCALNVFVSGDNLRKGAALNTIQIAELAISV